MAEKEWKLSVQKPLVLKFKNISTSSSAAVNVDPVPESSETKIKEKMSSDKVSEESKPLSLPIKKRRFVKLDTDKECIPEKEEEVVAFKRPRQAKDTSAKGSVSKKKRREIEQEALQAIKGKPSMQTMQPPHRPKTWLGVPGIDDLPPTKPISDPSYWRRILQENLFKLEDSKILKEAEFTKEQEEILEKSFMLISWKMSAIMKNSDRFMKIYKCLECEFSVSHQCLSLDRIRQINFGLQLMNPSTLIPERTTICLCGFAFFHNHVKRLRPEPTKGKPRFSPYLREYNRSGELRCPKCCTDFVLSNRNIDACCDLNNWDDKNDLNRNKFYTSILKRQNREHTNNFDEFFGCSKGCCLLYHCCPSDISFPITGGTSSG